MRGEFIVPAQPACVEAPNPTPAPVTTGNDTSKDEAATRQRDDGIVNWVVSVALVAWLATLVAAFLGPALPGWRAGISELITGADRAGAILSQLAVVAGCLVAFGLLMETLREGGLGIGYRIGISPLVAIVVTTSMAAATRQLGPLLALVLGVSTAFLALLASIPTLLTPATRGAGLVLALAGLAASTGGAARFVAVRASSEALASVFVVAQVLATLGSFLMLGALGVGLFWAANGRRRWQLGLLLGPLVVASAVAILATRGGRYDASSVAVLANRALSEAARHPQALLPAFARHALDVALLVGAPLIVFARGRNALARAAVALALLARGATDIPLLGLCMTLAALSAPLAAARTAVRRRR